MRLVASGDLRTRWTIPEGELASALARVGPPGRPTLDGFVSTGSDTRDTDQTQDDVYTAYDLDGRQLWTLPAGAADGICEIGRGLLLLRRRHHLARPDLGPAALGRPERDLP